MATKNLKQQKYLGTIKRAGLANQILGWMWLTNGVFWATLYFGFSVKSNNPLVAIGSLFTLLGKDTILLAIIISILMASAVASGWLEPRNS